MEFKKVRKNITMSQDLADWYENKAKEMGIFQSNLMVMALNEYVKQDTTIKIMSDFEGYISKFEEMAPPEKE